MAELKGNWIKLEQSGTSPGARSSHAITVINNKLYTFGGEFTPRVPVDNHLYIFDLNTLTWSIAESTGEIPPPRVGVTMTSSNEAIYIFGGRDADHTELNDLYAYDTRTSQWTLLSTGEQSGPANRSYHSAAADEHSVYVFGGCGVEGRLNDLWAYDVVEKKWSKLPEVGEKCKGRGGPGLVVTGGRVWVVYGFAGKEVDDVHSFDLSTKEWREVETKEKPSARSVFSSGVIDEKYVYVFGGEVDPSDLGHLGAGKFSEDMFALDTETLVWRKVQDNSIEEEHHPGARGWCAFAGAERDGKQGLIVYGGNSDSNDRLDDIFFFTPCSSSSS